MKVIIPAAGCGSRLGFNIPKSLIDINGKSIIKRQLDQLKNFEVRVVVGYKKELMWQELQDFDNVKVYENNNFKSTTVVDSIRLALNDIKDDEDILIVDGDVLFDINDLNFDLKSFVCVKKEFSNMPVTAIVYDNKIYNFDHNGEVGDYEWACIAKTPSGIFKNDRKFICDCIIDILPLEFVIIDSCEIDTIEDLEEAKKWIIKK